MTPNNPTQECLHQQDSGQTFVVRHASANKGGLATQLHGTQKKN
jgi:hypothetical protein